MGESAQLVLQGLMLDAEDEQFSTALHFASTLEVAELLLQAGVNPDHKNKARDTPLHAAYAFNPEVVDFLITHGASAKGELHNNLVLPNNLNQNPSLVQNRNGNVPVDVANHPQGRIGVPGDTNYTRSTGGLYIPKI